MKKTLITLLLGLSLFSCKKEETKIYFPCDVTSFNLNKGNFSICLKDMRNCNVKEVKLDIRNQVSDTFKIKINGKELCLYLLMNYNQSQQQNLITWLTANDSCLNQLSGYVNEEINGYINTIYWK